MGIFGSSRKTRLGIDIGSSSVKLVEVENDSDRFKLINYGVFELDPASVSHNLPTKASERGSLQLAVKDVARGIKEIIKRAGIKTKDVAASMPSYPTFSTIITMPYLSQEEIDKSVAFEARKYVPVPLSEVELQWAIINTQEKIKPSPLGNEKQPDQKKQPTVEVFLVAVPKDDIARYQVIIKEANLDLVALELENFALIRSLIGNDLSPIAVVSLGGRGTSILVVEGGYQRVSRDFEIGSYEITKVISKSLNVNVHRAEELKKKLGIAPGSDNIIRQSAISLIDMIVYEIGRTIHSYEEMRDNKVSKVLVVGGMANMPHAVEYFAEKLNKPVYMGNSLARVIINPELEPIKNELSTTFAVATGLAMRETK